jgi:hypothetical protein
MVFDGTTDMQMSRTDELGLGWSKTEKNLWEIGLPLYKFNLPLSWTQDFLNVATVQELDKTFKAAQIAYARTLVKEFQKSIFYATNATVYDKFASDNSAITVRRWWNNDGANVPPNMNGDTFSNHTHFLGKAGATVTQAEIQGLILKVTEHDNNNPALYINKSDWATLKNVTGFAQLTSPLIVPSNASDSTIQKLELGTLDSKMVGLFDGVVPVYTRPWGIANFVACLDLTADPTPVAMRVHENPAVRGLMLDTKQDAHLVCKESYAYFGFGCVNRGAGAVIDISTGSSTYTSPTIS